MFCWIKRQAEREAATKGPMFSEQDYYGRQYSSAAHQTIILLLLISNPISPMYSPENKENKNPGEIYWMSVLEISRA
jgi:hypothetical protein